MIDIVIGNQPEKSRRRVPDCLCCVHFKVSWDADFPRSCEIFTIKSRNMPSIEVLNATGRHCPAFVKKEGLR
ncbi:MAG: hypothetical protein LBD22_06760 [Spirochaetaceae bacterium]|jgi:hypothetical protein|nr:hypothetical protein [Spirochaetaceae bacterium]